jgi:protein-L-isoaspartate O-methyltransferase
MEKKLYFRHGVIEHPKDIEYFTQFPAPLMELIHSAHFTNINSTITFFGPMLYFFARAIEAHKILEIGHAECYTAWYLANAVKDNGMRYQVENGQYYGIDITQTDKAIERLKDLPATIINGDSIDLNEGSFKDIEFDLIFQDGAHDEKHVLHEIEILYPKLKGEGRGYFIMHDVYGPSEEAFHKLIPLIQTKYNFEWCRIWSSAYGLAILRKMDGYDPEKRYWRD